MHGHDLSKTKHNSNSESSPIEMHKQIWLAGFIIGFFLLLLTAWWAMGKPFWWYWFIAHLALGVRISYHVYHTQIQPGDSQ